jgi:hypothetical protein
MFNEQLEKLVSMALIDGVLTDKEREILKRKAIAQGFDEDEFEMILEAKLYEKQNPSSADKLSQSNSSSHQSMPEQNQLKGIHLLFQKISDIENETKPNYTIKDFYIPEDNNSQSSSLFGMVFGDSSASDKAQSRLESAINDWEVKQKEKILNLIQTFPIPSSKNDVIEFLTFSIPLSIKGGKAPSTGLLGKAMPQFAIIESFEKYENEKEESEIINQNKLTYDLSDKLSQKNYSILLRYNWKLKSEQTVVKGRTLCEGDSDAKKQIEEFAKQLGMKTEGGGFFGLFK